MQNGIFWFGQENCAVNFKELTRFSTMTRIKKLYLNNLEYFNMRLLNINWHIEMR